MFLTILQGTLPFVALDVLEAAQPDVDLAQTAEHDIESFAIVFAYAALRKLLMKVQGNCEDAETVGAEFYNAFGHHSLAHILHVRRNRSATKWVLNSHRYPLGRILKRQDCISPALRLLLVDIDLEISRVAFVNDRLEGRLLADTIQGRDTGAQRERREAMSYEFLAARIDEAIALSAPQS